MKSKINPYLKYPGDLSNISHVHQIIRIREVSSANASLQQEKDSDIVYYKSTIEELNEQVNLNHSQYKCLATICILIAKWLHLLLFVICIQNT